MTKRRVAQFLILNLLLIGVSCTVVVAEPSTAAGQIEDKGTRILQVQAYDGGNTSESTFTVDVVQHECPNGSPEIEPFHDTLVGLTIANTSEFIVRFEKFRYKVRGKKRKGRIKSRRLSLAGIGEVAPLETEEVFGFLLDVDGQGKRFVGRKKSVNELVDLGIKNVQFILFGINSAGQRIRLTSRTALSFDDVERCSQ